MFEVDYYTKKHMQETLYELYKSVFSSGSIFSVTDDRNRSLWGSYDQHGYFSIDEFDDFIKTSRENGSKNLMVMSRRNPYDEMCFYMSINLKEPNIYISRKGCIERGNQK